MSNAVVFSVTRSDYSIEQVVDNRRPMTVAELRDLLEELDDDDYVILSHDHGYTYGNLPRHYEIIDQDEFMNAD